MKLKYLVTNQNLVKIYLKYIVHKKNTNKNKVTRVAK